MSLGEILVTMKERQKSPLKETHVTVQIRGILGIIMATLYKEKSVVEMDKAILSFLLAPVLL